MAATGKPDGYTIAQMPITVMRLPLMQKATWDAMRDFTYIVHLTGYTFGITAKADGQFKSWNDVVEFAKANPGKVTYATPGAGTSLHIGMEQIAGASSGIQITQVPFKGNAESNAAVLGGHTTLQADGTGWKALVGCRPASAARDLDAEQRSKNWPDAPTLKELRLPVRVRLALRHRRPASSPATWIGELAQWISSPASARICRRAPADQSARSLHGRLHRHPGRRAAGIGLVSAMSLLLPVTLSGTPAG